MDLIAVHAVHKYEAQFYLRAEFIGFFKVFEYRFIRNAGELLVPCVVGVLYSLSIPKRLASRKSSGKYPQVSTAVLSPFSLQYESKSMAAG